MKRVSVFLLALLILISLCVPAALADGDSFYYISGLNAFITVPDDLIVFTREEFPDTETLNKYGLTDEDASDILDMMVESNVFLRALDISGASEHVVVCSRMSEESGITDFAELSDSELDSIVNNILTVDGAKKGVNYTLYDLYRNDEASYIALTFTSEDEGIDVYGLEYYTVKNGNAISIILRSYGTQISSDDAASHHDMVDSLSFYNDDFSEDTIIYESEDSGFNIGFLSPAFVVLMFVVSIVSKTKKKKKSARHAGVAPAEKSRVITVEDGRRVIVPQEGSIVEAMAESQNADVDFYTQSYRKPTTYCGQCGAKVYDNSRTCPVCGAKIKKKKRDYDL